ncbi:MAG: NUDIX domain-containing protein [Patescibacteria group bacterium]
MINSEELLLVVDENNNPIKPLPRKQVHSEGHWHRTAHIFIVDGKENILCQQRSMKKDQNPGKWEPFFGGHLLSNHTYFENAIIELREELGINADKKNLTEYLIHKNHKSKEFTQVFVYTWIGKIEDLVIEKDEVEKILLLPISEVIKHYIPNNDIMWTQIGYEGDLLDILLKQR